jgi:tetratricopeptide (TPR) repeat protein
MPAAQPPTGRSPAAPFIGRARELDALDQALAGAREGAGRVVLLVGEPGIGKTRLAEEFTHRARAAGGEVLTGRCYEGPGAPAFWPWAQVVRAYARERDAATLARELGPGAADVAAVVPELHAQLPGLGPLPQVAEERARFRLFEAVTRALVEAAARRPLIVVLEDLHGADSASLLLLQFVAREIGASRVLVVGTLRDVALAAGHALAATLGELVREQVSERLELTGLGLEEVAELMGEMAGTASPPGLAAAVHARTEGNPLYVTEIVRMLVAHGGLEAGGDVTLPARVRSAIARHLEVLSAAARATLTLAALFGREFRIDVVARAGGVAVDAVLAHVDQAVTGRIVAARPGEPGRYRFVHALFAETLVEALGEAGSVTLHCRAAAALGADPRAAAHVPEIAHHWFAAGPGGDAMAAVTWSRRAADRALAGLAYEEAAARYRQALTALGWVAQDDAALRAELHLGLGEAAKRAGAAAEAKAAFEQAAAIGRTLGSPEILTRAALGFAPTIAWGETAWPDPAVVGILEEAIASWEGRDASLHARALARLGMALLFGAPGHRADLVSSGVEMARRVGDPATLRYALAAFLGSYQVRFEVERRLDVATELVRLAEPTRDLEPLAVARTWRCVHLVECGDVAAAAAELTALTTLAEKMRQPAWLWHARLQRAIHEILKGRFAEAERAIHEAYEIGCGCVTYAARGYQVGQMLFLALLRGNPDATDYRALFESHPDPVAMSPLAWVASERERYDEAREVLERFAADDFATVRNDLLPPVACLFLAEACAALHDAERAAPLAAILAPSAGHWIVWAEGIPLGPAAHPLGLLARTMGRLDEAAEYFEHAIAECRRVDAPPFLARALYEHALLLRARDRPGDGARAAALMAEARAIAEAIGMRGLERKIAALAGPAPGPLAARGEPRTPAAPAPPAPGVNVFRREADYWVISYDGTTIRLRDARGVHYLATLLQQPGREFHVIDLVGTGGSEPGASHAAGDGAAPVRRSLDGGAAPLLDGQARDLYRRRLRELEEEVAEAEEHQDLGRAERARGEWEALRAELVAAARGGRSGSHGKRARVTVTKGIGAVLARIAAAHPALGAHLRATVRRGYVCAYVPDPRHPIVWEE